MKKALILAMLAFVLGWASLAKADQIFLGPSDMGSDLGVGAATTGGCVICQASPAPDSSVRKGGTASFALTGISADVTAGRGIPTGSTMKPECDPPGPTPEPVSMVLFGTGLVALAAKLRRRAKA